MTTAVDLTPVARDVIWTVNSLASSKNYAAIEPFMDLIVGFPPESDEAQQVRNEVLIACYPHVQPRSPEERELVRESYLTGECRAGRPHDDIYRKPITRSPRDGR